MPLAPGEAAILQRLDDWLTLPELTGTLIRQDKHAGWEYLGVMRTVHALEARGLVEAAGASPTERYRRVDHRPGEIKP